MKVIGILGSTGSIGTQLLEIINDSDEYSIQYLSAHSNVDLLINQALKFKPKKVCIVDTSLEGKLTDKLQDFDIDILSGKEGIKELSSDTRCDIMVNAIVGYEGMTPTVTALNHNIDIALANKESLVMAGYVIQQIQNKSSSKIFPIDSEHSAIWQCIQGEELDQVERLIITASGGPFREKNIKDFSTINIEDALNHPNWSMGNKITIDSATMMNKGFEVIEAYWLFKLKVEQIDILVHPQSIVHSMIEFLDGSVKAQLGVPDMKIPIQYAITYPDHKHLNGPRLDLTSIEKLTFEKADHNKFPCIRLAYETLNEGGSSLAVLNIANDIAVSLFLDGRIQFTDIPIIIEDSINSHQKISKPSLEDIIGVEEITKRYIFENLGKLIT